LAIYYKVKITMGARIKIKKKPPQKRRPIVFPTRFELISAEPETIDIPLTKTNVKKFSPFINNKSFEKTSPAKVHKIALGFFYK